LGFRYGAVIELEADASPADYEQGFNADKTYLFLETRFGRLEMGANTDAASTLKVDASNFARATGGIHGDWMLIPSFPGTTPGATGHAAHGNFIVMPALPLHAMHGASEDANKLTYYTPNFSGLQAGFSYSP